MSSAKNKKNECRVLLVEDDSNDALLFQKNIEKIDSTRFVVQRVKQLEEALEEIRTGNFDIIILDLDLPDASDLEAFQKLMESSPQTPIVILSGQDNQELAMQAVRQGAQDYLRKNEISRFLIEKSLLHAIERQRLKREVEKEQANSFSASRLAALGVLIWELTLKLFGHQTNG